MGLARPKDGVTALIPIGSAPSIGVADEMAVVSIASLLGGGAGEGQAVPVAVAGAPTIGPHGLIHELAAEAAVTGPLVSVLRLEDVLDMAGHGGFRLPVVDQALPDSATTAAAIDLQVPNDIKEAVTGLSTMAVSNSPSVPPADLWFSTSAYVATVHDHVMAFVYDDGLTPAVHALNDRILIDLPPIADNHLIA